MNRRLRKTDCGEYKITDKGGQHMHANYICINCHGVGRGETHYPDCKKPEVYAIPSTAEAPRRKASKRQWDTFIKKYVYSKPVGWWFHESESWWYQNNK